MRVGCEGRAVGLDCHDAGPAGLFDFGEHAGKIHRPAPRLGVDPRELFNDGDAGANQRLGLIRGRAEIGVGDRGLHERALRLLVFEMHVEHAVAILAENRRGIETGGRHPAEIETHADPRIAFGEQFSDLRGVAISGAAPVIVDRELDVVFADELLEVVPLGGILGLDDDELDAHQAGEFEEFPVRLFVE